jgi:hypothetical protein
MSKASKRRSAPALPAGEDGQLLRDVFGAHNLDSDKPEHWVALVKALAEMSQKRAGRSKQWTDDKLFQLSVAFYRAQRKHPDKSENNICKILANRGEFGNLHADTLRRRLHDTRDPSRYRPLISMLENLGYEPAGGNSEKHWREWLKGSVDVYENDAGKIRLHWPGLVRK